MAEQEKVSEETTESPKEVTVTRQQYRQIDFLRLFRLCRNLGLFNRKRKMPKEYNSDDLEKDDKNARSACRRLLRILIVHIFPDHYNIKSNFSNYFIEFPPEMRSALSYINNAVYDLERSEDKEYREAAAGYRLISSHVSGFVYPRIPYSIKIHFSSDQRRRYRDVRRLAMGQNTYGDFVFKPPEDFYNCAKACLEYKEHWEKYADLLIKVAERHKREREKKRVEVHQQNLREERSRTEASEAARRRLADAVAHSAEHGPRNTQTSFDTALQRLLERRNDEV